MATISTHNGSQVSKKHNERDYDTCIKESHIDLSREHENWVNYASLEQVYDELFGEAVKEYNLKQKRDDRKIDSYFRKIEADKQKHSCYEMIIGVYDDVTDKQTKKEILKEFVDTWQERNPNLRLIGAYFHADEQGKDPHVHIDYIPVATGQKRGLSTQNALKKALGQMGFEGKKASLTAQMLWERRENDYLAELCQSKGISVERQLKKREHLDTDIYKQSKEKLTKQEQYVSKQIDDLMKEDVQELQDLRKNERIKTIKIPLMGEYVAKKDYDELERKHNKLHKFASKLVDTVKSLKIVILEYEQHNINLNDLLNTLREMRKIKKIEELKQSNKELSEQLEQSQEKIRSLTKTNNRLDKDLKAYIGLGREYQKLKKEHDELLENSVPKKQYDEALEDVEALKEFNEEKRSKLEKQEHKINFYEKKLVYFVQRELNKLKPEVQQSIITYYQNHHKDIGLTANYMEDIRKFGLQEAKRINNVVDYTEERARYRSRDRDEDEYER